MLHFWIKHHSYCHTAGLKYESINKHPSFLIGNAVMLAYSVKMMTHGILYSVMSERLLILKEMVTEDSQGAGQIKDECLWSHFQFPKGVPNHFQLLKQQDRCSYTQQLKWPRKELLNHMLMVLGHHFLQIMSWRVLNCINDSQGQK